MNIIKFTCSIKYPSRITYYYLSQFVKKIDNNNTEMEMKIDTSIQKDNNKENIIIKSSNSIIKYLNSKLN